MDGSVSSVWAALVAAAAELDAIPKRRTAKAGSFSYFYADLADVLSVVRPVLARHGLAVIQDVRTTDAGVEIVTIVGHASGETIAVGPLVMPAGDGPQAMGSAITYGRRYALLAALGLAAEDDDGQAAQQSAPARQARTTSKGRTARADAMARLAARIDDGTVTRDDLVAIASGTIRPVQSARELDDDELVRLATLVDGLAAGTVVATVTDSGILLEEVHDAT